MISFAPARSALNGEINDVITIMPFKQDLKRMVERLRALPRVPEIEKREPIEPRKTDWD